MTDKEKSFKEIATEESKELVDEFLSLLPVDQKVIMEQIINNLINDVEEQIVNPIVTSLENENKE